MARVESLGLHTPVALPYLIDEGILPKDPKKELYQFETYVFRNGGIDIEEEVLATRKCVVWSQGKFIRNVYNFDLDGEDVHQAILTTFPNSDQVSKFSAPKIVESVKNIKDVINTNHAASAVHRTEDLDVRQGCASESVPRERSTFRALVVFLRSKIHVHFLHGASHIVDLPFEIERALPTVRGCLVERKRTIASNSPPTPQIPSAPPNSFFASQTHATSPYLQSPILMRSFAGAQPPTPSPVIGSRRLGALFEDLVSPNNGNEAEETASLYTLTSPLSDFGVVSHSVRHSKPRLSTRALSTSSVSFETLDPAEHMIYISAEDELCNSDRSLIAPLILLVTANDDTKLLTVWHAWYVTGKSLRELLMARLAQKEAKARRRSSFLNASVGTGATTPNVRHREHTRESLLGGGSLRLPADAVPAPQTGVLTRKRTRQEEEAVMASQMDPDYQPTASQQTGREARRVSSMNPDARASQSAMHASFGTATRRNTSFGVPSERRSFGHRKRRGSTPGSIFSRSVGTEDDLMDVDDTEDRDTEELLEAVIRRIRASFEAAGADSVFGSAEENFKRELVVRKLHSFPCSSLQSPGKVSKIFKVVVLQETSSYLDEDDTNLGMYFHDTRTKQVRILRLLVKHRTLWPEAEACGNVAVPMVVRESISGQHHDVVKIRDNTTSGVLVGKRGIALSTASDRIYPLPSSVLYRVFHPLQAYVQPAELSRDVGKSRTIPRPESEIEFGYAGSYGSYDELATDGIFHRRRVALRPTSDRLNYLLAVCETVLPPAQADTSRSIWCVAHAWLTEQPNRVAGTAANLEFIAFAATVLRFVVPFLDAKALAALELAKLAVGEQKSVLSTSLRAQKRDRERRLFAKVAWAPMAKEDTSISEPTSLNHRDKDPLLYVAATIAVDISSQSSLPAVSKDEAIIAATKLMQGLHLYREEQRLGPLTSLDTTRQQLGALIAQLGSLLGLNAWSYGAGTWYGIELCEENFAFIRSSAPRLPQMSMMIEPLGVLQWFETALQEHSTDLFPSLAVVAAIERPTLLPKDYRARAEALTPRITLLSSMLQDTFGFTADPALTVECMARHACSTDILETLPDAIAAPFREAMVRCEREPPTAWSNDLLRLVGREDLVLRSRDQASSPRTSSSGGATARDVQAICHTLELPVLASKTREAGRHAVSQLIFSEDRRLVEASALMHFNSVQTAECPKQPDWTDQFHLEQQRRVMQWVLIRMIALPIGDGMIHFDSQTPLMTEKFHLAGFNSTCLMQPMGHALTIDRSGLTEEKVNWAYFHAGASAGLRVSRLTKGIDTSWIAFNKPTELTNRHAGLLLALGLGGHLRAVAKWLSFKYLTPKHPMTSVGLLLGLSASYIGSMDSLITRMLSVHITRMLPPGAAELNVSPITQSAGLLGIGLLYYNTQHRRMSEIMVSEIKYMEVEDPDSGPDQLRDESYRLAAGFALGLINLGKGQNLRGLHGIYLPERLLAVAVGSRPISAVHVFDRATAGAIIAIALIYMKTGDRVIARRIDIPDTQAQFDHVRPDMLMLRAMAKQIILWADIRVEEGQQGTGQSGWIESNLPACHQKRLAAITQSHGKYALKTSDVPFYNIATGLAWALSMKYAGSGKTHARDEILAVLECFYMIRGGGDVFYYDAKLARSTLRRCIDVLALSAATVMAGTGDIKTFRYLRRLHGRVDPDTTYGSHLASHLAIGVLFLGGGTYTLGTSDLAVASLMCAFYPLYPTDVHDNRVHLQAFRHLWVFAAEARCLVIQDSDTSRPLAMPISVSMKDGSVRHMTAPCLLPDLDQIAKVQTEDPAYWHVTLDFAGNPAHLAAFRQDQHVYVRRCPASEAHSSIFSATLAAANDTQSSEENNMSWQSIFDLPGLRELDKADIELILPMDMHSSICTDERGTVVDSRLALARALPSNNGDELRNLRILFAWAEKVMSEGDGQLKWIGNEVVEALRAKIEQRSRGEEA